MLLTTTLPYTLLSIVGLVALLRLIKVVNDADRNGPKIARRTYQK